MPTLAERRLIRPLRKKFDREHFDLSRYSATKRVEGRNADGTISVRPLGGECVERSNICSAYSGQLIEVPCGNGLGRLGATGIAMARVSRLSATMWFESMEPDVLARGSSVEVTITGGGFTEGSVFEFLLPGTEDVNPGVVIVDSTFVSFTEFTLVVEVANDAILFAVDENGELIPAAAAPVAFDNPG